jgi:hypothetical protein
MSQKIVAFAVLAVLAGLLIANWEPKDQLSTAFESFKTAQGKVYRNAEEEKYRKTTFMMNLAQINAHNAD